MQIIKQVLEWRKKYALTEKLVAHVFNVCPIKVKKALQLNTVAMVKPFTVNIVRTIAYEEMQRGHT